MNKHVIVCIYIILCVLATVPASASVSVSSPGSGSTVGSSVKFVASAATSCSKGVASMGIYPAPYQLAYTVGGASLNTYLNFNPGTYNVVVQEWDNCGGSTTSTVGIYVVGGTQAAGVYVTSPPNNSKAGIPAHFFASATTSCPAGISAI